MVLEEFTIKYKVQPGFVEIEDYLKRINFSFSEIPFIIQNRRNDIRVHDINGFRLVIKSFVS